MIYVSDLRLHFFNSFYHSYQYAYYLIFVLPYSLQVINVYNNYDEDFEEYWANNCGAAKVALSPESFSF